MRFAIPTLAASALLASAAASAAGPEAPQPATLTFVAPYSALVGNAFGMDAIDSLPLVMDQRHEMKLESGLRTVWYSCPGEAGPKDGSRMSFAFEAGKMYELVCRTGQEAAIREADNC